MTVLLGQNTVGSDGNDFDDESIEFGSKYVAGASGTVDTITIRLNSANTTTGTLSCAIYSDSAGTPNARIGNVASITLVSGSTIWIKSTTGIGASVASGTTYWILFWMAGSVGTHITFSLHDSATVAGMKDTASQGSFVTPWPGTVGSFTELVNAYAEDAVASAHTVLPSGDLASTGWTTTPLFSKVNDASDSTVITATLA